MKCDKCNFLYCHTLGRDECGGGNYHAYCGKGHWEGGNIPKDGDVDVWEHCDDFNLEV